MDFTDDTDFQSLVTRYLSGELAGEERRAFEELLQSDPEKKKLFVEFEKTWSAAGQGAYGESGKETAYDMDAEWKLFRSRLPREDFGAVRGRTLLYYTWRVAAVLVAGLILTFAWIYATRMAGMSVVTAANEPVEVHLPDGSVVTLNMDSRLRYRSRFDEGMRKVFLSGEAWFDVARDTSRPFIIEAGSVLVEVLGTRFNVNAYRENPTVEIIVESGIVALSAAGVLEGQIVLRAGNAGAFHRQQKQLELVRDADPNALSWKTRDLYFDETALDQVAEVIGKVYNTRVILVNPLLSSCTITVTFHDQSLEAVLKVLEMTLDLRVEIRGDRVLLDGKGCADQ